MNNNWIITPNGISNGNEEIRFSGDENAVPFYVTHKYGVICGYGGNSHSIPVSDKLGLVTMKIVRSASKIPDYFENFFSDVDLSECRTKMEMVMKCAKVVMNDIYTTGRYFDLTDTFGQVVFMFWDILPLSESNEIISIICDEKGLDKSNAVVARVGKNSPDTIYVGYKAFDYKDEHAYGFFFSKGGEVKVLPSGIDHTAFGIKNNIKNLDISNTGRVWDLRDVDGINKAIFSFWQSNSSEEERVISDVCDKLGIDLNDAFIAKTYGIFKVGEDKFEPSDRDYDLDGEQEALQAQYDIHNPQAGEDRVDFERRKKDSLGNGYRDEREKKLSDKLKYADKDGSMTDAEYRWRTSMDENKVKTMVISESQLNKFKKKHKTIKRF